MRYLLSVGVALTFLLSPAFATAASDDDDSAAPEEAAPEEAVAATADVLADPADAAEGLVHAIQAGDVNLGLACVLMLLVWLWQTFGRKLQIPKKYLPLVANLVAVAGTVSSALVGGGSLADAILQGLMVGTSACGLWGLAGKHVAAKLPMKKQDG
tara:strand:+ start:866 stop:1333 length:468 start_codon:yes stop_codon:yes gene_type:complete